LRERREDILLLATHFLECAAARYDQGPKALSSSAYNVLLSYSWPGNVRELKNAVEEATVLSGGAEIQAVDLRVGQRTLMAETVDPLAFKEAKQQVVETFERDFIMGGRQWRRSLILPS
jgi:DNA-binding NtrC family response regulator